MNLKITSTLGCVDIRDERMMECAKKAYSALNEPRELNIVKIEDMAARGAYKRETPFGCIYAKSYETVMNSENAARRILKTNEKIHIVLTEVD